MVNIVILWARKQLSLSITSEVFPLNLKRDTAGEERFRAVTRLHYRGAVGALIIYDITNRSTFKNVKHWLADIKMYCDTSTVILLIGNKSDLRDQREVSYQEASEFANQNGLMFAETSAKT